MSLRLGRVDFNNVVALAVGGVCEITERRLRIILPSSKSRILTVFEE